MCGCSVGLEMKYVFMFLLILKVGWVWMKLLFGLSMICCFGM